jgi:hypothetical protein
MKYSVIVIVVALLLVPISAFKSPPVVKAQPIPVPVFDLSGYELLLGKKCTIAALAGKCGVEFAGWTGGGGQSPTGWEALPGNKGGLWSAELNYTGTPDFGESVTVQSGEFNLLLKGEPAISGTITGGSVTWPDENTSSSCGTNVATVSVEVNSTVGYLVFTGCLHDLPVFSEIPPKIWGSLTAVP